MYSLAASSQNSVVFLGQTGGQEMASGSISHAGTRNLTTVAFQRGVRDGASFTAGVRGGGGVVAGGAIVLVPFVTQMLVKLVPGTVTAKCPVGGEG